MSEHETPDAKRLLQLKNELLERWQQLPSEHQATMTLVLMKTVMEGEYGAWLQEGLNVLFPMTETALKAETLSVEPIPISWVSKTDLVNRRPDLAQQIEALSEDEAGQLAKQVGDALQETYWIALGIALEKQFGVAENDDEE